MFMGIFLPTFFYNNLLQYRVITSTRYLIFSICENSLVVQLLGLPTSTAGGTGLIPGRVTKIPRAAWPKKKISVCNQVLLLFDSLCIYRFCDIHSQPCSANCLYSVMNEELINYNGIA